MIFRSQTFCILRTKFSMFFDEIQSQSRIPIKVGSEVLTAFPRLCLLFKGLGSSKFRVSHFLKKN